MSLRITYDANRLEQAGWGLIFPAGGDPASLEQVRSALAPLLEWRRLQTYDLYREVEYQPGETANAFMARHGLRPGLADPERMPYYLLIVATPAEISFDFQAELGASYAVGRLSFDNPAEYANYTKSLIGFEQESAYIHRAAALFAPAVAGDWATGLLSQYLVNPLVERFKSEAYDWKVDFSLGPDATKDRLSKIFQDRASRLLLAASHGFAFPESDPRQQLAQGALACADWPGAGKAAADSAGWYFSAADLPPEAELRGKIAILFSDYSLGTPQHSTAQGMLFDQAPQLSASPFVARLPQALLAHPNGGMLAVAGLADKIWNIAFPGTNLLSTSTSVETYSVLHALWRGATFGHAMESFRQSYTARTAELSLLREDAKFGKKVDSQALASTWAAATTARNLLILGDPAVRAFPSLYK